MKKFLMICLLLIGTIGVAQTDDGFGIKAGLNYGSTGDLKENGSTIIDNPDEKLGYHIGVFGKLDLGPIYLRPEIQYTKLSNEYNGVTFDLQKLDAPILVGFNVIGPLHVFAGPSLQYVVDTDLEDVELSDVSEDFTVGAQFGVGVNLGNLGIDVRYERGFNDNEVSFINNNVSIGGPVTIDTRPEQIIVALSLKL
ncbi:outer membrane protein with beta-barrel domain [Nonlabens xylanidelens]|uniref:Outer membrane protein with beta-barrel domain n=1 Tax=Nonlabens xylanidelens TaxID=191564 RepID=A0A2S6IDU3_9FLAO|nr:porin family protein [Nonlabens xylanidelens]PPK92381.1 outer membrane protein with beta-barrel domain [Nonlabens xylanidelens]PQJ19749.1 hypothetical protein BST94_05755 [Nonlabens xylanidelens]